jgi:hypothetical protein
MARSAPKVYTPDLDDCDYSVESPDVQVENSMTYNTSFLKAWGVFHVMRFTVWTRGALWFMMLRLLFVSIVVAIAAYMCIPDPDHLDIAKFIEITSTLNLFLGVMLSFFLKDSVERWSSCVDGFLDLFNSIRNLGLQLHAMGADKERTTKVLRYGVISSMMLMHELKTMGMQETDKKEIDAVQWRKLRTMKDIDTVNRFRYLTETEQDLLEGTRDICGQMWLWVGSLIGRMSQDGDLPPMQTPTYGRVLNICQTAQESLRQVRYARCVKVPFIYVHTLATLVHITNGLFAVSLGLVVGASAEGLMAYARTYVDSTPDPKDLKLIMPAQHVQTLIIETIKCLLAPLLYHAFFLLGCGISSPFNNEDTAVPVSRMLSKLTTDLSDGEKLARNPPTWNMPSFKPA